MSKLTFVIDLDRCIGCKGCQVACKMENDIALGVSRNAVKQIGPTGTYPNLQMYFLPVMCQHCENPACVAVCPTGACYQSAADGVVYIDQSQCIGCQSCKNACPYGVNILNRELRVMDKCNLCADARARGEVPACARNCSGSALMVGDIDDPQSNVSRRLAEAGPENVYQLRDFGNKPSVRYILRHADWIDVMPQACGETQRGREH